MHASQAVITEPLRVEIRGVDLPAPAANQVLVKTEFSAVSAGTELAVFTGMHQWLSDPNLPDWKFPFRPGYSAAGEIIVVGREVKGWQPWRPSQLPGQSRFSRIVDAGT
jgi:NADPH:quinone reductase-like Zn-dependent oxidoreductase